MSAFASLSDNITPAAKAPELFSERIASLPEEEHAKEIITRFTTRAFRQSVPDAAFVESLSQRFARLRAAGDSFEAALKESLSVVLASPGFLYLSEPGATNQATQISDLELAARLSYFLWSAPPDAALNEAVLNLKAEQSLLKLELSMLKAQIERLEK